MMYIPEVQSNTVQVYRGEKFFLCGEYFQKSNRNGSKRLHRVVYEDNFGSIPNGYHVHHIDHNKKNNSPENLQLIYAGKHISHHWEEMDNDEKINRCKKLQELGKEHAKLWHKSEDGAEWHKKHYKQMKDKLHKKEKIICSECGKEFDSISRNKENRFCSKKCKSKHRRDSGVDNVDRKCIVCGSIFSVNKYSKSKTCNRKCSARLRA
jgi:hypothetical protein